MIFDCKTGLVHILVFIAGAIKTGLPYTAMTVDVKRVSAMPDAIFPIILAVAGAMSKASAFLDNEICAMSSG